MIDTRKLYRLPWTLEHNANGWIEPTTHCQLKCPFCYRGAHLDGFRPEHMPLAAAKREADELIRLRRVGTITIAGGDPLLYPDLIELIDHIRSRDVEVMVLTNGIALDQRMLETLKEHGTVRVVIHIDKHQGRPGIHTEAAANVLRHSFCELARKVGGITIGFIQPIRWEDLDDLEVMIPFFKDNADVVDLVTFNRLLTVEKGTTDPRALDAAALFERFRQIYGLEYAAYLGKTHSTDIGWVLGMAVFSGKHFLGCVDKDAFRYFQEREVRRTGKFPYTTRSGLTTSLLSRVPFNRSLRNISWRYLRQRASNGTINGDGHSLHVQRVLLVNPPQRLPDGELDRCKGCPDAMLYKGKLVPSCWLENIKNGQMVLAM
ncbi:MAG: radical SAM protein [Acidobacteria bacterium]|nr:radical SAM protein [Acidobacteriota bacterium]